MEQQSIINTLENTQNRQSKFGTKNWLKINDDSRRTNYTNCQIKFKISVLKAGFCDHSDAQYM